MTPIFTTSSCYKLAVKNFSPLALFQTGGENQHRQFFDEPLVVMLSIALREERLVNCFCEKKITYHFIPKVRHKDYDLKLWVYG